MAQTTHKASIIKIAVVVLLALLVCTVISRTLYTLLLPQVTVQHPKSGTLVYTSRFAGHVTGKTNQKDVLAADNWTVKEVLVEDGQSVIEGDVLFVLDMQEYQIRITQLDASIQQQLNTINGFDWSPGDRLVRETELKAMQMQRAQAYSKFPSGGKVKAPATGVIADIIEPGLAQAGSVMASISAGEGDTALEWRVLPAQAKQVLVQGVQLDCTFDIFANEKQIVLKEVETQARMLAAEHDAKTSDYLLRAALQTEEAVPIDTPVQIVATAKSKQYELLVPLSVIMTDEGQETYLMVLEETRDIWGLVTRARRVSVEVLESDGINAAISQEGYSVNATTRLAAFPSRTLREGEIVRVMTP